MSRFSIALALAASLFAQAAGAHTPLFDCFDNRDGTLTCEGGFSDGASAEGVGVRVVDLQGKVLARGKLGPDNSVTFDRPSGEFSVVFEAGEGHEIRVFGEDIY